MFDDSNTRLTNPVGSGHQIDGVQLPNKVTPASEKIKPQTELQSVTESGIGSGSEHTTIGEPGVATSGTEQNTVHGVTTGLESGLETTSMKGIEESSTDSGKNDLDGTTDSGIGSGSEHTTIGEPGVATSGTEQNTVHGVTTGLESGLETTSMKGIEESSTDSGKNDLDGTTDSVDNFPEVISEGTGANSGTSQNTDETTTERLDASTNRDTTHLIQEGTTDSAIIDATSINGATDGTTNAKNIPSGSFDFDDLGTPGMTYIGGSGTENITEESSMNDMTEIEVSGTDTMTELSGTESMTNVEGSDTDSMTEESGTDDMTDIDGSGSESLTDIEGSGTGSTTEESGTDDMTDIEESGTESITDIEGSGTDDMTNIDGSGTEGMTDIEGSGMDSITEGSGIDDMTDIDGSGTDGITEGSGIDDTGDDDMSDQFQLLRFEPI